MSPEISTTNRVRYRVAIAEKAWREALELVRQASAAPDYTGPALEDLERVGADIAEIRTQVRNLSLDEQVRRASRPRRASRGQSRTIRRVVAELYHGR
jgi:hypothetical protein